MWRKLFNAPWPDDKTILPQAVQERSFERIHGYWKSRGWQLVLGEVLLWAAAYMNELVVHKQAYGFLAGIITLAYILGLFPSITVIWLSTTVVVFMIQGMFMNGLGAITAVSYMLPYTFAGMLLSGRKRLVVQAWCVVAFWVSLFYEAISYSPQLEPPRYILVSYNILLAAFTFQSLRFLNHLAVETNTIYVTEQVQQQSQQFLARVSHELRTPLNSVLGFAKLLNKMDLDDSPKAYLGQIIGEGEHLNRLVSDLLDSAHLSTGKLTLTLTSCNVNDVCKTVADECSPNLPDALVLTLDLEPDLPTIEADTMRLHQAIGNLVSNSVKHTPDGSISIKTRRDKGNILVEVRDTGKGIPEEQQKLVFVPFVQLDNRKAGVGLGLDIALNLVRLHGGTIELESKVGEGSAFTVYLPVKR